MNCCDGNCEQGRQCPARVAKYRPVMLAAEPLPAGKWRGWLKSVAWWFVMAILGLLWLTFLVACAAAYA